MALTPVVLSAPFATANDLFIYHDANQVADLLRDADGPRPQVAGLLVTTTTFGAKLYRQLKAAAELIVSKCLIGNRYQPTDLQALATAGCEQLLELNSHLCFWGLSKHRQSIAGDPTKVPGAKEALDTLEDLKNGAIIFPFIETAAAGLDEAVQSRIETPTNLVLPVTERANRFFGTHGAGNSRWTNGNGGGW